MQRQQQQSAGLPSGRDLCPSPQQQGSHDSASNQPQHLSIGFAATGEVLNTSVNAATFQQLNLPFQPQTTTRQLELPQLAQKEQLGLVLVNWEHQPQDVSESSPDDTLSSPDMSNAPADHPKNHVQSMPTVASGSQPQPGMPISDPHRLTWSDLNMRARGLTHSIAEAECTGQAIAAQIAPRGDQVDPGSAQRLKALDADIVLKKDNLSNVTAMMYAHLLLYRYRSALSETRKKQYESSRRASTRWQWRGESGLLDASHRVA